MKFNNEGQRNLAQPADELDRVLDEALAKYAAVEPRVGLEERVLAHLRSEPLPVTRPVWQQWSLAGAVAIIALAAILAWRSNRAPHPVIADHPPTIQGPSIREGKAAPPATAKLSSATRASMLKPAASRAHTSAAIAHPKLDQFPSPQPLSREEIALVEYVKNFPKEARLVSEAQQEFELETQKIMNDAGSEVRPSGSIQQER